MNKFYLYITLFVGACVALLSSCDSDDTYPYLYLSQSTVCFGNLDDSIVISFSGSDIASITIDDLPSGWDFSYNLDRSTITFYGPTTEAAFKTSLIATTSTISATSDSDNSTTAYVSLSTTDLYEDISDMQSNSFIVTEQNKIYSFSALTKGESDETISPAYVSVLWQSSQAPVTYARLIDGSKVEFHVKEDTNDVDGDESYDDIVEGNAVIAAYDSSGTVLWSWHIWVVDYSVDDSTVELNGITLMDRNIGALTNATTNSETIIKSYGMYYQWGRKDPFYRPYYYDASGSSDGVMINKSGSSTYITYASSTSTKGTEDYATTYPLTYLLGVEDSTYDWVYSDHSDALWSDVKNINDPCPKGWKVASSAAFENLSIPSGLTTTVDDYGWTLTDSEGNSSLFMGLGRRSYITGKVQIVNLNETRPAPWSGFYWSSDASVDDTSSALFFSFDAEDISGNMCKVTNFHRANGMQVRCQRDN